MTRPEFLILIDDLLELPKGTLTGQERLEDLERWDSLAMISFMAITDEHAGVRLAPRQFVNCERVSDLLDLAKVPA